MLRKCENPIKDAVLTIPNYLFRFDLSCVTCAVQVSGFIAEFSAYNPFNFFQKFSDFLQPSGKIYHRRFEKCCGIEGAEQMKLTPLHFRSYLPHQFLPFVQNPISIFHLSLLFSQKQEIDGRRSK